MTSVSTVVRLDGNVAPETHMKIPGADKAINNLIKWSANEEWEPLFGNRSLKTLYQRHWRDQLATRPGTLVALSG